MILYDLRVLYDSKVSLVTKILEKHSKSHRNTRDRAVSLWNPDKSQQIMANHD